MASKHPHIIVIGAGIVGAGLTYHLAKQNARVTLLDKAAEPASEATDKSFAWIVAGYDETELYMSLRQQAIKDWHRVEDELNGRLKIDWTGALTWLDSNEKTEEWICKLRHSDSGVRLVEEQELRLLEPNLKVVPALAMFAEEEGAINPALTTNLLIRAAQEWGAKVLLDAEVFSLLMNKSAIEGVVTDKGNIKADMVVLATGVNTASLCHPLHFNLPIHVSPAILLELHHSYRFVNHIVSNPFMEIRAASDTLTLAAENYIDESWKNNPTAIAQRTIEVIKQHWQGAEQVKLVNVKVGKRPMPKDGLPVVGRIKDINGLYLCVMHSGVTLAAVAGRLAAAEILTEQDETLLSSYRPQRFL